MPEKRQEREGKAGGEGERGGKAEGDGERGGGKKNKFQISNSVGHPHVGKIMTAAGADATLDGSTFTHALQTIKAAITHHQLNNRIFTSETKVRQLYYKHAYKETCLGISVLNQIVRI